MSILTLFPLFVVVIYRYLQIREDADTASEIVVLSSHVTAAVDSDTRLLRLQHHYVAFDGRNFYCATVIAPATHIHTQFNKNKCPKYTRYTEYSLQ